MLQSVTIPRGQALLAAGFAKPDARALSVTAKRGETRYGIRSTDFLEQAFGTGSDRVERSGDGAECSVIGDVGELAPFAAPNAVLLFF